MFVLAQFRERISLLDIARVRFSISGSYLLEASCSGNIKIYTLLRVVLLPKKFLARRGSEYLSIIKNRHVIGDSRRLDREILIRGLNRKGPRGKISIMLSVK